MRRLCARYMIDGLQHIIAGRVRIQSKSKRNIRRNTAHPDDAQPKIHHEGFSHVPQTMPEYRHRFERCAWRGQGGCADRKEQATLKGTSIDPHNFVLLRCDARAMYSKYLKNGNGGASERCRAQTRHRAAALKRWRLRARRYTSHSGEEESSPLLLLFHGCQRRIHLT